MTKDEIIVLLKEQLQLANDTVSSLTIQVGELIERIKSLEEQLVQKGIAIDKANRQEQGARQARFRQKVRTSGEMSARLNDSGRI